jgi:hypothetical protein
MSIEIAASGGRENLREALCFEHGFVGYGVKSLLQEWNSLMKTKEGRETAFARLERCAELLDLDLDGLSTWYAQYEEESHRSRRSHG